MVKQFLLNADGSIPAGADLEILAANGIPLVMPTARWRPADGMMLVEADPAQDADGVWRQVWTEIPTPSEPPTPSE